MAKNGSSAVNAAYLGSVTMCSLVGACVRSGERRTYESPLPPNILWCCRPPSRMPIQADETALGGLPCTMLPFDRLVPSCHGAWEDETDAGVFALAFYGMMPS